MSKKGEKKKIEKRKPFEFITVPTIEYRLSIPSSLLVHEYRYLSHITREIAVRVFLSGTRVTF